MVWCFGHDNRMFQNWFMPQTSNLYTFKFLPSRFLCTMEDSKKSHGLKSMVFNIQYMKKKK